MNYSLNIGEWNSIFAVPSVVVDRYIKLAGANSLKLLLYLLRHGGEEFPADKLKADLGFVESGELEDAALFWIQRGIIRYSNEESGELAAKADDKPIRAPVYEISPTVLPSPARNTVYVQQTFEDITAEKPKERISPANVDSREIASRINTDPEIQMLFSEAEKIFARQLRPRDNQTIIALVDHYGLPSGVALMLLSYCFKVQKTSPNYIQSAAAGWAEEGIDTIEKADAKIRVMERRNDFEERLRSALDMTSGFTPQQKKYIGVWTDEWKFSEEMILLACTKTIDQIGKWKASYTNKILENWKRDGIATPEAADAPKQPVLQAAQRSSSFDTNDIMSKIKNRYNDQ